MRFVGFVLCGVVCVWIFNSCVCVCLVLICGCLYVWVL